MENFWLFVAAVCAFLSGFTAVWFGIRLFRKSRTGKQRLTAGKGFLLLSGSCSDAELLACVAQFRRTHPHIRILLYDAATDPTLALRACAPKNSKKVFKNRKL